jgi:hypothetical protein
LSFLAVEDAPTEPNPPVTHVWAMGPSLRTLQAYFRSRRQCQPTTSWAELMMADKSARALHDGATYVRMEPQSGGTFISPGYRLDEADAAPGLH